MRALGIMLTLVRQDTAQLCLQHLAEFKKVTVRLELAHSCCFTLLHIVVLQASHTHRLLSLCVHPWYCLMSVVCTPDVPLALFSLDMSMPSATTACEN